MFKEDTDGIDHINIHLFGKTTIGSALSNTSLSAITIDNQNFVSVEGLLFYNIAKKEKSLNLEVLKNLYDTLVQRYTSNYLDLSDISIKDYTNVIRAGLESKVQRNTPIINELIKSKLPLTSYNNSLTPDWFLNTNSEDVIEFYNKIRKDNNDLSKKYWLYIEH